MMDFPHRRFNPLTREWVLVSPHRARRPWQGQVEKSPGEDRPTYDPTCYLCPGNERAGGIRNPAYTGTFAFDNDSAAILPPDEQKLPAAGHRLFQAEPVSGICRVVCFSPRHDLTLPELTGPEVEAVLRTWTEETRALGERDFINYVQVFENKGAVMGFHQAPTDKQPQPEWHLHLHFYPPLLRSASVKKFMVGYEMLAMPQRDLTPETAAERLRALSEQHYRARRERAPID